MRKKLVVVYSRVSSGSQDLREQIDAAKKLLKVRNINEKDVLFLEDFSVSATKNDISNRPSFNRLMQLVSEGKVATIIIYSRDRAYRDFYEGSRFNALVNQHGVEVVYTATGGTPFLRDSSLESLFAIFAQQEGENIRKRIADAVNRYPGQTIGYHRIETKTNEGRRKVTFVKDNKRSHFIASLFEEFSRIQSLEEFVAIMQRYGKDLGGHKTVLRILQRPFYAAHCLTDYGYDELDHVEPIITMELFKKVQVKLKDFIAYYEEQIMRSNERIWIMPVCGICSKEMTFRTTLNKPSYFVCSNRHKRVAIELDELNEIIESTIIKETEKFTMTAYDPVFRIHLNGVIQKLHHQKRHKELLLERHTLSFASEQLFSRDSKLNHLKTEIKNVRKEIETIDRELELLRALKYEVETISNIVNQAVNKLNASDLVILIELLVKQVQVYHDHLEFSIYQFTLDKKGVG